MNSCSNAEVLKPRINFRNLACRRSWALRCRDHRHRWLPKFLWPPPPAADYRSEEIREGYAYFQPRILFWTTIGYGTFYFVRKNLTLAMPVLEQKLGISKSELGIVSYFAWRAVWNFEICQWSRRGSGRRPQVHGDWAIASAVIICCLD